MRQILEKLLKGNISLEEAEKQIQSSHIKELEDFAKFDMHRESRTGFPEAILAPGKEDEDIIKIIEHCVDNGSILVTRLEKSRYESMKSDLDALNQKDIIMDYYPRARILVAKDLNSNKKPGIGKIGIITAGTSDIPVAEEAKVVAQEAGCEVIASYDVGVAGIHRLFSHLARMMEKEVQAIIVVAGMEGALPSVVAGLVDVPVIGVPTSVGYGVGKDGFTALHAMLQSCAPGIAVVNIDNGFGAAVFAVTIVQQVCKND
jgi:NCAIR mutase (PurE)-related protein